MVAFYSSPAQPAVPAGAFVANTTADTDTWINAREALNDDGSIFIDFITREIMWDNYQPAGTGAEVHFGPNGGIDFDNTNPKGGSAVYRLKDSNKVRTYGGEMDGLSTGANGAIWGIVVGQSFLGDPRSGACEDIFFSHVNIHDVRQSTVKFSADGTRNCTFRDSIASDAGKDTANPDFGEGVYLGEGNDLDVTVEDVLVKGNDVFNCTSDIIDIKIGCRRITVEDNQVHGQRSRFGGLFTIGADFHNPGYTGDHLIQRNRVWDSAPGPGAFTQDIDGMEVGTQCTINNNVIWDLANNARGIRLVRQFLDQGKTVVARFNTIDAVFAFGLNDEAPNGGGNNEPGVLIGQGNLYTQTEFNLGPFDNIANHTLNNEQYTSGFVGASGGTTGGQYALVSTSPHVNDAPAIGAVVEDICGVVRPQDGQRDWGAFEFEVATLVPDLVDDVIMVIEDDFNGSTHNLIANDISTGDAPFTVTHVAGSGAMPPSYTISPAGVLSGFPVEPGVWTFDYQVEDSNGDTDTATVTYTIVNVPEALDDSATFVVGVPVAFDVTANDDLGVGPSTFTIESGTNLPPGMSFDTSTGILSGTPAATGSFFLLYDIVDSNGNTTATTNSGLGGMTIAVIAPIVRDLPACSITGLENENEHGSAQVRTRLVGSAEFNWSAGGMIQVVPFINGTARGQGRILTSEEAGRQVLPVFAEVFTGQTVAAGATAPDQSGWFQVTILNPGAVASETTVAITDIELSTELVYEA